MEGPEKKLHPLELGHFPAALSQLRDDAGVEHLPEVVRELHEQVEVPAAPPVVAEHVFKPVAVVLFDVEARLDVPPAPPPFHDLRRHIRAVDVVVRGEHTAE